jgi:hypothetical protein
VSGGKLWEGNFIQSFFSFFLLGYYYYSGRRRKERSQHFSISLTCKDVCVCVYTLFELGALFFSCLVTKFIHWTFLFRPPLPPWRCIAQHQYQGPADRYSHTKSIIKRMFLLIVVCVCACRPGTFGMEGYFFFIVVTMATFYLFLFFLLLLISFLFLLLIILLYYYYSVPSMYSTCNEKEQFPERKQIAKQE